MKNLFFKIIPVRISDYIKNKQSILPRLEHLIYGTSSLRLEIQSVCNELEVAGGYMHT